MKLRADIPAVVRYLDYLYQVCRRIDAHALHAALFVAVAIGVVELVAVPVPFHNGMLSAVGFMGPAAFAQVAGIGTQTHRPAQLRDGFLFLHQVDDIVRRLCVDLAAVGVRVAQHVARKLNHHHLHTEADAEGGYVVRPRVGGCQYLALRTALPEARTDDNAGHVRQLFGHIIGGNPLAVDEVEHRLHAVIDARQGQALADTLVGILQVVLAHQADVYLAFGMPLAVQKIVPRLHGQRLADRQTRLAQDGRIQSLFQHTDGHLVDAGHVLAQDDAVQIHIAERGHLHPHLVVQMAFRAEHEDIGLYAHSLQLLYAVLCRFGLHFFGRLQVGHVGQVYRHRVAAQLPAQLADGLHKRRTLDVADGAAHLRDDKIQLLVGLVLAQHAPLDLVRDMRHHLYGLAQVVSPSFAVDNGLVDSPGGDAVVAGGVDIGETLVVPQIQVRLHAVHGDIALAVFVRIQGARVDVDVGVELLDGDGIAARLQQFADAGRDDALAQRRYHAAGDEDIFRICVHLTDIFHSFQSHFAVMAVGERGETDVPFS